MIEDFMYDVIKTSRENHVFQIKSKKKKIQKLNPAIFFDRDGVLIEDKNYISCSKDVFLLEGVRKLLLKSYSHGWLNIVITNQSGIYRGFLNWYEYEKITMKMIEILGKPLKIHGIYANGCSPSDKLSVNSWRKPNPNMILEAANDFNIDLKNSILVGDRLTDLESGKNAGIRKFVHVLTGHGEKERDNILKIFNESNNQKNLFLIDNLSYFPIKLISKNKP